MPNTNNYQVRGRGPSVTIRPSPSTPTDYASQQASIARLIGQSNTQAFEAWYREHLNSLATGLQRQPIATDQWFVTWTGETPKLVPVHSGSATKQEAIANALISNKREIRNMLRMVNNYLNSVGVYTKKAELLASLAKETT